MPVRDFHTWLKFAFKLLISDQWDVISERVENGDQSWRWLRQQLLAALKDIEKKAWQKPVGNAAFTLSEQLLIRFKSPMLNEEQYNAAQHHLERQAGMFALRDGSTPDQQRVNGAKLALLEGTLVHFDKPECAGSAICSVFTELCDVEPVVDAIYENKDAHLAAEIKVMFDCSKEYAETMKLPIDDLVELEFDPSCLPSDPPAPFKPPETWVFGENGMEDGFLSCPDKVQVDKEGNFLVMDQDLVGVGEVETIQRIQLFNPLGKFIKVVLKRGEGKVNGMCDFCLNKDGNLVVVDEDDDEKSRIQIFDYDANQVMVINEIGKDDPVTGTEVTQYVDDDGNTVNMISNPSKDAAQIKSVYVDDDGNMICVDGGNTCIRIYGPDGKMKTKFGKWGRGEGQFLSIEHVTAQGDKIYVVNNSPGSSYDTLVFNYDGEFLFKFYTGDNWYFQFDEKDKHFYTIEGNSIVILGLDGTTTKKIGGSLGSGLLEFWTPTSVVVLEDGRIAVSDRMNNRIQVFKC